MQKKIIIIIPILCSQSMKLGGFDWASQLEHSYATTCPAKKEVVSPIWEKYKNEWAFYKENTLRLIDEHVMLNVYYE